ncbi:GNAT family acetyltransferase [Secundilactobacillus pentosiphilus]|uniref:GNAT family acetyltransferase n=1 Tax=Secundilactobacillus pentosiphilus TaxID=1714682 RepID=A0A1Z5IP14_9LACO|nr:GNAT family N-acetyltransferase [Secundilactobacillus pentosiphilus]GAX03436.1 GNAT family acetyltransferase [Secundilactobacillus pentosiphilus]
MNIRPIEKKDNQPLKAIIQAAISEYGNNVPGSPYYDTVLDHLAEHYAHQDRAKYWVAEVDGELVGGAGLGPFTYPETAEFQKLYLSPAARGHHIGHQLEIMAEKAARKYGYKKFYIETFQNYKAARGLYQHVGFKQLDKPLGHEPSHAACNAWYLKNLKRDI